MTEYAEIRVTETRVFRDHRLRTYEWQGPRWATTRVPCRYWNELRKEAPWPLKWVWFDGYNDTYTVARADGAARFTWLWWTVRAWLKDRVPLVKTRFILSLMVWNLAYVPEGERVDWCHVGRKREVS